MKLLVFKIDGDIDDGFAATLFERAELSIEQIYKGMLEKNRMCYEHDAEDEDGKYVDWRVTLFTELEVKDHGQALKLMHLFAEMADDDWLGDYDRRKHCDYTVLLIED